MTLQRGDFPAFFAAVHGGHRPFRWQERLLDHLLESGRWPEQVAAPTGAGKTAVIDVHVFAVALMAVDAAPRVPRRLALVVDRRVLVDSQFEHVQHVAHALGDEGAAGVVGEVAAALRTLRHRPDSQRHRTDPVVTGRLRGGLPPSRSWRDDPTACVVLSATPDMWGSRVLLRGYGASWQARPVEAGLLAFDAVVVVDEAHLARQLVHTARRIGELQRLAVEPPTVPGLQVVENTATPTGSAATVVAVAEPDLDVDAPLRQRLTTAKPVRLAPITPWPLPRTGSKRTAGMQAMAAQVAALHQEFGGTVGCFVNTVALAVDLGAELATRKTTELLCGRLRPHDVAALQDRRPGLLTLTGNPDVEVLIATQTLEVGVDVSFSAAVSELAPAAALAQRAGRVNRLGESATTAFLVMVPVGEEVGDDVPPYQADELREGLAWITRRAAAAGGLAPWELRGDALPPAPHLRRRFLHRLEPWDTWQLARTSDRLAAEPDLALWLADDLDADTDVGVLVRAGLGTDPVSAVELLRALPPAPHEVFPVGIGVAGAALKPLMDARSVVLRVRARDVTVLGSRGDLRPGDLVVVDAAVPLLRGGVVDRDGVDLAADVYEVPSEDRDVVLRLDPAGPVADRAAAAVSELLAAIDAVLREELPERAERAEIADLLGAAVDRLDPQWQPSVQRIRALLPRQLTGLAVTSYRDDPDGPLRWLALRGQERRRTPGEDSRQVRTPTGERVALADHGAAVGQRAAELAEALELDPLVDVLRRAGLHHDAGKADPRFQVVLGAGHGSAPLAKSGMTGAVQERAARARSGLPAGWRHEQLSAVFAAQAESTGPDRDVVIRLVGTSHGHGRASFPHSAGELLGGPSDGLAGDLFDDGRWDELIERTDARYGVWGCALLEAVLRGADGQVSGEGR